MNTDVPAGDEAPDPTHAAEAAMADDGDAAPDAPGESDVAPGDVTVEELLAAFESVTAERDQHLTDLQRVSAEFANFRKQTEKRNADFRAQAGSRVAEALLPVLDAFDAASQQGVEGVDPIAGQLRSVLQTAGLEVIATDDEPFDPTRHEAAMSEPGDEGQDVAVVAQVLRTGYAWNGRVLRAAMVKVKG